MRGDVRKCKCVWDIEEELHPHAEISQNISRQGKRKCEWDIEEELHPHANGRRHPNCSIEESDHSLKFNDPLLGKSDVWKDDDINKDARRWPSDDSFCVRRLSTFEEREQEDQQRSLKNRREHMHRERSRSFERSKCQSQSLAYELKWELHKLSEQSRSGPEELSHTHRNSTAGHWRKDSLSRFLHHDDCHHNDRGLSENDYARTYESRPSFGGVSRGRTSNRSPNRIQCLNQSPLQKFQLEQSDISLGESGETIKHCRCFFTDSISGYLGKVDKRYKDKTHREIKSIESLESGDEYGRSFRNNEESTYSRPGRLWTNTFHNEDERSYGFRQKGHQSMCKYHAMGKCRNGDKCSFSHDVPEHSKAKGQSKNEKRGHGMEEDIKLWTDPTWDNIAAVLGTAKFTGWGKWEGGNRNCANIVNAKSPDDKMESKCQSWDGKRVITSIDNKNCAKSTGWDKWEVGNRNCANVVNAKSPYDKMESKCQSWDGKRVITSIDDKNCAKSTGWGKWEVGNRNCANIVNAKGPDDKMESKCRSWDGKRVITSIDDTSCAKSTGWDKWEVGNRNCAKSIGWDKWEVGNRNCAKSTGWDKWEAGNRNCANVVNAKIPDDKMESKCQSWDGKRVTTSIDDKKMWNCPVSDDTDKMDTDSSNETRGDLYFRSIKNSSSNRGHKPEYRESGDTLCTHLERGKCRDGDHCRFSHGDSIHEKEIWQSRYGKQGNTSDDGKKLWNGPTWDDVGKLVTEKGVAEGSTYHRTGYSSEDNSDTRYLQSNISAPSNRGLESHKNGDTICKYFARGICGDGDRCRFSHGDSTHKKSKSQSWEEGKWETHATKLARWGNSDAKCNNFSNVMAASSKSYRLHHDLDDRNVSPGGRVLREKRNVPNSSVAKKDSFQEPRLMWAPFQSQTLNETNDSKNSCKCPTWNDTTVPSDSSKWDMQGKMKGFGEMVSSACFQSQKTDKIDLPYIVDVMQETSTSHLAKGTTPSTERRPPVKQDGGYNDGSLNVTSFSPDPIQQNQFSKTPMNSISEQENNDCTKIKGIEPKEVPFKNQDLDSTVKGDDKEMLLLRNALIELVKEILVPTWKEGRISKDVYKTIVKKVADKVCGTIKGNHIPKTRESVNHYLSSSRPSITKLVQAYLEIYPKI